MSQSKAALATVLVAAVVMAGALEGQSLPLIAPDPTDFFTLPPCRVIDTRAPDGPQGGPALVAGADRVFPVAGICGIPPGAKAISANIAVTAATAPGNLRLHPGGSAVPLVSSINYSAGQTRSNNTVVSPNDLGELAAFVGAANGTVDLILDVNGFFATPSLLTVTKSGNGAGTVTSSPAGINCGADCSEPYNYGTPVTLTAAPSSGSTFVGWAGGGCSGTGTCVVTITAATTVSATFTCSAGTVTLAFIGGLQSFTVPACVTSIRIDASGAGGGIGGSTMFPTVAGKGARMSGDFAVAGGTALSVLVGEKGQGKGPIVGFNGGGGGGSFVWQTANQTLLIAAGGGGGGGGANTTITPEHYGIDAVTTANGTNGNGLTSGGGVNGNGGTTPAYLPALNQNGAGGTGWLSSGAPGFSNAACTPFAGGGQRPLDGGAGGAAGYDGVTLGRGGFGGGGGAQGICAAGGGGGGGGYSGGGGGASGTSGAAYKGGGGGGSFNGGSAQLNTPGWQVANGVVTITW